MTTGDDLERGRRYFLRRAWGDAFTHLASADRLAPLGTADLELLAIAAHLLGKYGESTHVLTRAYHEFVRLGDLEGAVRSAFWTAMGFMDRGEMAQAGGWLTRAQRLLDESHHEGAASGYLLVSASLQTLFFSGDAESAYEGFGRAIAIGERFGEPDVTTFARLGRGRSLIGMGRIAEGLAMLDDVMISVTAGEVGPVVAGIAYCAVIDACREIFDLRRAQEWTAALSRWCETQPDLVPYRGQCLVHRAQIMQLHGDWPEAMSQAELARGRLSEPPGQPAVGMALYQLAELQRLRGEFAKAEDAYRRAADWGHSPHPGLAQLRLAQGQLEVADAAIRRVVDETVDRATRTRLLPACVEIMLAADDVEAARAAADELSEIAEAFDAAFVRALAAQAHGAVHLADGDPRAALVALQNARRIWQEFGAPYEVARVRSLIGAACRELGDEDTAAIEIEAARRIFRELGAEPDLNRLDVSSRTRAVDVAGGLTGREVEVLRLIAAGKTNRAIAHELVISEKTVARHVSNIFTKLGLSSRAAATAHAYKHGLV